MLSESHNLATLGSGYESNGTVRIHEKLVYGYDASHNLSIRSNNPFQQTFTNNNLNQLTDTSRAGTFSVAGATTSPASSVAVNGVSAILCSSDNTFVRTNVTLTNGNNTFTATAEDSLGRDSSDTSTAYLPSTATFVHDGNGNLVYDGNRACAYDDENQLTSVLVTNSWKSEFVYDGKGRRRIRKEYKWTNSAWLLTSEVRYVYSGNYVVQERNSFNLPLVTYTRLGGRLLARTDHTSGQSVYYHADGNGNITALMNGNQAVVGRYQYDPFGNTLFAVGPAADANVCRYASKELHLQSGLILFLYRAYDPSLQRWLNSDRIGERGGLNLYTYVGNDPLDYVDPFGLDRIVGWYGGNPIIVKDNPTPGQNPFGGDYTDPITHAVNNTEVSVGMSGSVVGVSAFDARLSLGLTHYPSFKCKKFDSFNTDLGTGLSLDLHVGLRYDEPTTAVDAEIGEHLGFGIGLDDNGNPTEYSLKLGIGVGISPFGYEMPLRRKGRSGE